ncbi:MAG: Gfo/Idh/MocA family oxidoreductase [Acidimicrobiales bacterium]
MTMRVAVIGAGGMGRFHAETLLALPGIELGAIADPYPSSEVEALGVPITTAVDECAVHGWDGVIIASPDDTHAHLTLLALDAGSRVLCEKPLSHDIEGAEAVVDWELRRGERRVQVGFMREYDPAHVQVAAELEHMGALHYLRCTHRNTNAVARPPAVVIVQSIIHDVHTVRWLGGEVVDLHAHAVPRDGGLDHVVLSLSLDTGAAASIEFSDNTYAYEVEVEATAAAGMVATSAPPRPRVRMGGEHRTPIGDDWFGWFAEAYRIQDRAWVASLHDGSAHGPSAWDGYAAQHVAHHAEKSLDGHEVNIMPLDVPDLYRP